MNTVTYKQDIQNYFFITAFIKNNVGTITKFQQLYINYITYTFAIMCQIKGKIF